MMPIVWKDEPCWVSRQAARDIVNAALEAYPEEMCGVLAGEARYGDVFLPVTNVHVHPLKHYRMSAHEQIRVWQKSVQHGGPSAVVHSHTSCEAYPSAADIQYAAYRRLFYVILSLEPRQLRAFSIDSARQDGFVWEHPLHVDLSKPGLWYCWVHMRYEDCSAPLWRTCYECGHSFKTGEDLLRDHNALFSPADIESGDVRLLERAEDVITCPHCVHDF